MPAEKRGGRDRWGASDRVREQGGVREAVESSVNDIRDIYRDIQYMEAKRHNLSRGDMATLQCLHRFKSFFLTHILKEL